MNEDIHAQFGELRSMLTAGDADPRDVFWTLDSAYESDPDIYVEQWHPYLRYHSPLKMLITSLDELEKLPSLLPSEQLQAVTLTMTKHHLRKWHFQQIADSDGSWFLRTLDISNNRAQNHYPAAFAHTKTLVNLHTLNMADCDLHALVAVWVLRAPFLASVRDLDLSGNPLQVSDVETFAQSAHITQIRRLNLSRCGVGDQALEALTQSPYLDLLCELDLEESSLSQDGYITLAAWPQVARLERLVLPWSKIQAKTRQLMVDAGHFSDEMKDFIFERTMPAADK